MTAIIIVVGLIFIAIIYCFWTYRKLALNKRKIKKAWQALDTSLRERFNILVKYIALMQKFAPLQKDVWQKSVDAITYANNAKNKIDLIYADMIVNNTIDDLFAIYDEANVKEYDDDHVYGNLYAVTEKISSLRQTYNIAVKNYNDLVLNGPSKIIALLGRFKPETYYEGNISNKDKEIDTL